MLPGTSPQIFGRIEGAGEIAGTDTEPAGAAEAGDREEDEQGHDRATLVQPKPVKKVL